MKLPRKRFWIAGGVALFLAGTFLLLGTNKEKKALAMAARVRAKGYPASFEELNKFYPSVPDSENGALLIYQGYTNLVPYTGPNTNFSKYLGGSNKYGGLPQFEKELEAYLETNRMALHFIHEGTLKSQFHYPIQYSRKKPAGDIDMVLNPKRASRLLIRESDWILFKQTNTMAAALALADSWMLSNSLEKAPFLITQLVRFSIIGQTKPALEKFLTQPNIDEANLIIIEKAVKEINPLQIAETIIAGEMVILPEYYRKFSQGEESIAQVEENTEEAPSFWRSSLVYKLWASLFMESDFNFSVETLAKQKEILIQPFSKARNLERDVIRKIEGHKLYFFSRLYLPPFEVILKRVTEAQSKIRLVQTALAIEKFHLAEKKWPESLAALTPKYLKAVPIDPYNGKPIFYSADKKGYSLSCADPDKKADVTFNVSKPE